MVVWGDRSLLSISIFQFPLLSPSLSLACSSRFHVSRVVVVLPTERTLVLYLYTYLSFICVLEYMFGLFGSEYDSYRGVQTHFLAHFEIRAPLRMFHRLCSPGVTFIGKVQNWRPITAAASSCWLR